jgi:hypothetical protein
MQSNKLILAGLVAGILAACGGGGSSGSSTPTGGVSLSGTAASGLAIANSTVSISCQGATGSATTKTDGTYTVTVSGGNLPCALSVTSGGQTYRSIVVGTGTSATANITPLTEMLVGALLQQNPDALSSGAPSTSVTADALKTAQDTVVKYLKENDIDVSALGDFVSTPMTAATTTPGTGDSMDQALDQMKAASIDPVKASAAIQTATASCPFAGSGKYTLIDYTGAIHGTTLDFKAMTITPAETGTPVSFAASSTYPCEFSAGTTTFDFASSGMAIYRDTGDKVIGILLPSQPFNKTAIYGDTYNMSGYFANNSGPYAVNACADSGSYALPNAQFGTLKINSDDTAMSYGGVNITTSTSPEIGVCPSPGPSINVQSIRFYATNADGSVLLSASDAPDTPRAYSYVAPNGKKLLVVANAETHTFLIAAKQEAIDPTKIEPNGVWFQVQGYTTYTGLSSGSTTTHADDAVISWGRTTASDITATQGSITQYFDGTTGAVSSPAVTGDPGTTRVDIQYWNTTTGSDSWSGMRHRNKDTTVTPNVSARTGMSVAGMGFSTNGSVNTVTTPTAPAAPASGKAGFTLSVKRPAL